MLLGLDYDNTYTVDPEGWNAVIDLLRARGHSWVCVTGRHAPPSPMAADVVESLHSKMPIVFAGMKFKREAAKEAGFDVEVWIDDCPAMIDKPDLLL